MWDYIVLKRNQVIESYFICRPNENGNINPPTQTLI